jgi:excisionase family DNA binding protein
MPPGTNDPEPIAVDRRTAAKLLNCSYWQMFQLTNDGRIPSFRVGRLVRVRLSDLDDFMSNGGSL